jgi:hypothetical protein
MTERWVYNQRGGQVLFRLGETRELNSPLPQPTEGATQWDKLLCPVGTLAVITNLGNASDPPDAQRIRVKFPDGIERPWGVHTLMSPEELSREPKD